jgi:hypothetical protein
MSGVTRTGLLLAAGLWLFPPGLDADPLPGPTATPEPTPTPSPTATPTSAPAQPAVAESVVLSNGRVLHHVRIMSDEVTALVVHADEGLMKLPKSLFPAGFAPPAGAVAADGPGDLIMAPFNPNPPPEPTAPPRPAAPRKPLVPKVAPTKAGPDPVYLGCTIISFTPKEMQTALGCAEVVIQNDTETPVLIQPGDLVCVTASGRRLQGRNMITDGIPPIVKKKEIVPAHGQVDDLVTFTNAAIEIQAVQWAH